MASLNKVILIGNLGRDPETRYTQDGRPVVRISLATNERRNDPSTGETIEETEWHRVVLFGKQAEVADQYLKKGKQIYVEGSLRTREYKDREGVQRYSTEIRGHRFLMLGRAGEAPAPAPAPVPARAPSEAVAEPEQGFGEDDIPF